MKRIEALRELAPFVTDDGKWTVGFSQMGHDNPWRMAQTASLRDEAKKRGYELVVTDAQDQTAKQVADVEDLIARRVDVRYRPAPGNTSRRCWNSPM